MNLFRPSKALWPLLLSTLFTVVGLFAPMATAMPDTSLKVRCSSLAELGWTPPRSSVKLFNRITKVSNYPNQVGYVVEKDLPRLKNAFLIYINKDAHALLWYKGRRVDSEGMIGIDIRPFIKETNALESGLVIAIHNLPENFDEQFENFIHDFERGHSFTCVQSACRSLDRIFGGQGLRPRNLTATGLVRYFTALSNETREKLGIEYVNLGIDDLESFTKHLRAEEREHIAATASIAALGTAVASVPTFILYLIAGAIF